MSRSDEILSVFEGTLDVFERVLSPLTLSREEAEAFQETVFLWFDRFTRRPGNERVPVSRFQIPLLSAACKLARDVGARKGIQIAKLSVEPLDLARELGLSEPPMKEGGA